MNLYTGQERIWIDTNGRVETVLWYNNTQCCIVGENGKPRMYPIDVVERCTTPIHPIDTLATIKEKINSLLSIHGASLEVVTSPESGYGVQLVHRATGTELMLVE